VYAQLPTSADNVALPAFGRHTLLLWPCGNRSISPAQWATSAIHSSGACWLDGSDAHTDKQMPDCYIDTALHSMWAVPNYSANKTSIIISKLHNTYVPENIQSN